MYKAPSFGLGMKKDLRESIESVYGIKTQVINSVLGSPQVTPLISEFNGIRPLKTPPKVETIDSRA